VSRSKYRRNSNRSAKILTTVFSVIIVLSFILSLVGPQVFRGSSQPTPVPTPVFSTPLPVASPTPSPTATPGIPTPVVVTPTASP
jgi:hypothetical protein